MSEMKPMDWALPVRMFESEFWVSADQVMARQQHAKEEIDRLTAERDDALAAADSKAGWEWKKRAEKAEAERDAAVADTNRWKFARDNAPVIESAGGFFRVRGLLSWHQNKDMAIDAAMKEQELGK